MKRKWIQLISTVVQNIYPGFFTTNHIYSGFFKNFYCLGLNCHSCPASIFACPLGILQNLFASVRILSSKLLIGSFSYILSSLFLFSLILGRFICGWLCPFGFFQDLIYKIPFFKKRIPIPLKTRFYFKFALLITIIILPIFKVNEFGYGILYFCKYICPAGTLEAGYFTLLLQPSLISLIGFTFFLKTFILIFFIILTLMDLRFFCKNICPLGLIYGIFNKIGLFKLSFNSNTCNACKVCEKVCPSNLSIPEEINSPECIRCLNCLKICPTKSIKLEIQRPYELSHYKT